MNRLVKMAGAGLCAMAVLASLGSHWLVLQSLAWTCMLADFSRTEPLLQAAAKTFDGKHPCGLCLKIVRGWHEEKQGQEKAPWTKAERKPELFCEARLTPVPEAPWFSTPEVPFVPAPARGFLSPPPKPPPRGNPAA